MKLLLDNTGLHRVHVVVSTTSKQQSVSLSDAMALLHFAEHIMFSEGMSISTFELPHIQEISREATSQLLAHGCISLQDHKSLLITEEFTAAEYADACDKAAPLLQEDLQLLGPNAISRASRLADFSTKPLGVSSPAMHKWVTRSWPKEERHSLAESALERKALGAFDYIVAAHYPVYQLIQNLARYVRGNEKKLFSLAMLLDVVFRVTINEQLSKLRECTYAPAPQRAKVTYEVDHLFRHAVARMIQQTAKGKRPLASRLIARIETVEQLPLPIFAIHFLGKKSVNSPLGLLDAARRLRDSDEVISLRTWLTKYEKRYGSSSLELKEKALKEIDELKGSLHALDEDIDLFSVFRPKFSSGQDGSLGVSLDLSGFAVPVIKLLAKMSRRTVFLAAVKRELTADQELGARICRIVGRPITG